jgi:GNAT superfamily N-acetyltransferase
MFIARAPVDVPQAEKHLMSPEQVVRVLQISSTRPVTAVAPISGSGIAARSGSRSPPPLATLTLTRSARSWGATSCCASPSVTRQPPIRIRSLDSSANWGIRHRHARCTSGWSRSLEITTTTRWWHATATRSSGLSGPASVGSTRATIAVAQIMALAVASARQRGGVGRMLIEAAEAMLIQRGARVLVVTSGNHRTGAHVFYEKNGYTLTGRRYKKSLTPSWQRHPAAPSISPPAVVDSTPCRTHLAASCRRASAGAASCRRALPPRPR